MKVRLTRLVRMAVLLPLCGALLACAGDPRLHASALADRAQLQHGQMAAGPFVLTTYARITRADLPLTVYIEGDGFAWRSRNRPSDDPTPRKAVGLQLAAADSGPNVLYIARPCQYTPMALNPTCTVGYWTGKRYAAEVVEAIDIALSRSMAPGQPLQLVGYSGGGALAVLIAARRHDVIAVRTVAGNLDVGGVNRLHGVSAMPESLDPIDVATRLARTPQLHVSGARDTIVPPSIAQGYARAAGPCARVWIEPDMSHESDWSAIWPRLLAEAPGCAP
ncbi:alpha/beta hydrolase [Pseudomonadota bacterium AL_CKDN230030165-1A_HGKHYDSX7]